MNTIALEPHQQIRNEITAKYPDRNERFLAFIYYKTRNTGFVIGHTVSLPDYFNFIKAMKEKFVRSSAWDGIDPSDQEEFTDFLWKEVTSKSD